MKLFRLSVLLLPILLGACADLNFLKIGQKSETTSQPISASPQTAPPQKKAGGYYLDDGPGDHPPANLDQIPDAVPKSEALNPRVNRPYIALGRTYTPMTEYHPYKQQGIASWYGRRYHGQKTSSGESYDMYAMTGAHTTLPIPSYARVTNVENGKSVVVRINDRGPFHDDRLIDLSYAASYKLGLAMKGSGLVEVEAIDTTDHQDVQTQKIAPTATPASAPHQESGFYIQLGAFKEEDNAQKLREKIIAQNLVQNLPINSWYNEGIYRVRIGPYPSRAEAQTDANKLGTTLQLTPYIKSQP
jgi:rare lipoprotein A